MERDSFIFYRSYYEAINGLKDKEQLYIFKAICELSLNNNEIKMDGISQNIFTAIKPQILANAKKYEAGKKRWQAKKRNQWFSKRKNQWF